MHGHRLPEAGFSVAGWRNMRSFRLAPQLAAFVACLSMLGASQNGPNQFPLVPEQSSKYSKEAVVFERLVTRVAYDSNGAGTRDKLAVIRLQSDAGVQDLAVLAFPYNQASEKVEVSYVRVRKPDGSLVVTAPQNIQDMPGSVTRYAPIYSDLHEKHVPVKSLSVGDVLEFLVRYRTFKPQVPGQFWFEYSFAKNAIVMNEELEISLPTDKYVKVSSPELKPTISENGSYRTYAWKTANLQRKPTDTQKQTSDESQASVQITTFNSWQDVGRWYEALQEHQVTVSPRIQAKAAELTKGLVLDNAKIRALYNFVSTHIHYVSLSFGIGRYQPHTAAEVLDNAYGDCKDKHTLLAALLKSAGYRAWPVLINSSRKIDPDVPSPGQFDHMITVVDQGTGRVWLDTTPEIAPFGLLSPKLRDKQALLISTDPSLVNTPQNPSMPNWNLVTIRGKVNSDGSLSARVQVSTSGDMEIPYRFAFRQYPQAQWDELVQQGSWLCGTVRAVTASAPDNLDLPFEFAYECNKNEYVSKKARVPLPFPPFEIETAINDDRKPREPVDIGPMGQIVYRATLDLPPGYETVGSSKQDISNDFAEYHSRYSITGGVLTAERKLVIKKAQLPVSEWEKYLKFGKAIRDDATRGTGNREWLNTILALSVPMFFLGGLVTVLTVWKKRAYSFWGTPSSDVFPDPRLTGIAGWLALFIIRLLFAVLMNAISLEKHLSRMDLVLNITFVILAATAAVLMMVKSHYGVKVASVFLLLEASARLLSIWGAAVTNNLPALGRLTGYLINSILWWVYLIRSRRVKNTYFVAEWTEPLPVQQSMEANLSSGQEN
jgi:transglutaminase-like putative cysteine protease